MALLTIEGGRRLEGILSVQGAKNSVLPLLAATLLSAGVCRIENCPELKDVAAARQILQHLGCRSWREGSDLLVDTSQLTCTDIPDQLMREMRSSVIFLGAILARCGQAQLSYPGGCELGPRPIDLHLSVLRSLGAEVREQAGQLYCCCPKLLPAEITLRLPSVGATENAILAACGAEGSTCIYNAAREPEIQDLQDFLCACGARVSGAGSSTITVDGGLPLHGCSHRVIPDRIVAATYLSAAAAVGGDVELRGVDYRALSTVTAALKEAGAEVRSFPERVLLKSQGRLQGILPVRTAPYPGFPTDAQAILMAALLKSRGSTVFVENIFENRYRHVDELSRMGADVRVEGRVAVVSGVEQLHGATVRCTDLRGGAALVIAALNAQGKSCVEEIEHIDRGYEDIARDLRLLGAEIRRSDRRE